MIKKNYAKLLSTNARIDLYKTIDMLADNHNSSGLFGKIKTNRQVKNFVSMQSPSDLQDGLDFHYRALIKKDVCSVYKWVDGLTQMGLIFGDHRRKYNFDASGCFKCSGVDKKCMLYTIGEKK